MHWILYVCVSSILLLLAAGGYVFYAACVRRQEHPWQDIEALKKTPYAKYVKYIAFGNQWLKDHHAQDVYMKSRDGLMLHAYWIPAENPKGTVILAHGYRSNAAVDFAMAYPCYRERGMNLLIPSQRAHGKSEGRYITFGVKESDDMLLWLEYHNRHFGSVPVIMSGLSMGASTMLFLADRQFPGNVKGIIADCGFTSPKDIIAKVIRSTIHLPAAPLLMLAEPFARLFAKLSLYEKDTRKTLANSKYPVMIVHGLADDYVPSYMTQQAFDACGGEKYLLLVEGAGHGTSFVRDRERYVSMIDQFLEMYL